jgi:hypothetical protein
MARHKYIQNLFAVIEFVIIFLFIAFLLTTTVAGLLRFRKRSRAPRIMPLPQSSNRLATWMSERPNLSDIRLVLVLSM